MLMDIRDVQDYLDLKLGPALKVCGVIKELKSLYLKKYAALAQETKECKAECSSDPCNGSHSCDVVLGTNGLDK